MRWSAYAIPALLAFGSHVAVASDPQDFSKVERGRYLVTLGDCGACHTASGGPPFAGGKALETPFGSILASNITPDRETGIGAMSDDNFVDSLQKGIGLHGRHIYPAMPYTYLTHVTRDDALAIRAYLATVTPVHHAVTEDQLPFPFSIRTSMIAWNALFFTDERFKPDPAQSPEWNRGAYLVEGLSHCGMCHTPKNILGGDKTSEALQGNKLQGWFAPNITNDARRGLGTWSVDDIVTYLRTGHNRFAAASGPMAEEVEDSSQYIHESDLHAIALYLKSRPGQNGEADQPLDAKRPDMQAGDAIYADLCSSCHTPGGGGVADLFPRLAGSPGVQQSDATSTIRVILNGVRSAATPGSPTGPAMPSFARDLDDAQVAAVSTYLRNSWGNAAPAVTAGEVATARQDLASRGGK